jgi:hypothetical protein
MSKEGWIRVTRRSPCPVCQKPDWCSISADGLWVHCMRMENDHPCKSAQVGGWIHRLGEPVAYVPPPKPKHEPVALADFTDLACQCEQALPNIESLAKELGLSVRSLERLQVGWYARMKCYTFPMRDGRERIVGIRVRTLRGKKYCVPGSHNGLFHPEGVSAKGDSPLLLPEGPTSCAACLDLGFDAIGRPNCELGAEDLKLILKQGNRPVVIVADHDEAKYRPDGSVYYPGQDGARKIAQSLKPLCPRLKIIKMPFCKDPRDFLREGGTHAVVECLIRAAKYL